MFGEKEEAVTDQETPEAVEAPVNQGSDKIIKRRPKNKPKNTAGMTLAEFVAYLNDRQKLRVDGVVIDSFIGKSAYIDMDGKSVNYLNVYHNNKNKIEVI